jgi:hypothetical protein
LKTETVIVPQRRCCDWAKVAMYSVVLLAMLMIGYILVHAMRAYAPAPALNAKRADERRAALAELNGNAQRDLSTPAKINEANSVYRLPIDRAMELTVQGGKNPAAFRSNLLARVENATKAPPKAPEKPSAFE